MIKSTTNIFSITLNPKSGSQYYPYPMQHLSTTLILAQDSSVYRVTRTF